MTEDMSYGNGSEGDSLGYIRFRWRYLRSEYKARVSGSKSYGTQAIHSTENVPLRMNSPSLIAFSISCGSVRLRFSAGTAPDDQSTSACLSEMLTLKESA